MDLEVVIRGEKSNGGVERSIVDDGIRDLVLHETFRSRRRRRFLSERDWVRVLGRKKNRFSLLLHRFTRDEYLH